MTDLGIRCVNTLLLSSSRWEMWMELEAIKSVPVFYEVTLFLYLCLADHKA